MKRIGVGMVLLAGLCFGLGAQSSNARSRLDILNSKKIADMVSMLEQDRRNTRWYHSVGNMTGGRHTIEGTVTSVDDGYFEVDGVGNIIFEKARPGSGPNSWRLAVGDTVSVVMRPNETFTRFADGTYCYVLVCVELTGSR